MTDREKKVKERREDVVLKLGLSPEIVKMYDMWFNYNSLEMTSNYDSFCIDTTDNLEVDETDITWTFTLYRDQEMVALITISKRTPLTRVRLW